MVDGILSRVFVLRLFQKFLIVLCGAYGHGGLLEQFRQVFSRLVRE